MANGTTVQAATNVIFEMAVPFARLELRPGDTIRFYVELHKGRRQPRSSAPGGDLRAGRSVARFRAHHVAGLR